MTAAVSVPMEAPRGARDFGLVLLPNRAMRARRCVIPILGLWAYYAVLGGALAWPFAAIVRAAYGAHPRADAVLWDPGSLSLLDLLVRRLPILGSLVAHTAVVTLLALFASPWPSAVVLVCLSFATRDKKLPPLRTSMGVAVTTFGSFMLLLVVTLLFQGSLVAAAAVGAGLVDEGFTPKYGELAAHALALAGLGLGLGAAALAGIVHDAARAAVIRFGHGTGLGIKSALTLVARDPLAIVWAWSWRAAASWVPVVFGGLLADKIGGRGGIALLSLLVIHQIAVAVRAALRTSWLASVMRAVDRAG